MAGVDRRWLAALLIGALTACATPPPPSFCASETVLVDRNFDGGGFYRCELTGDGAVDVEIRPEDPPPINVSPWYALRLSAATARDIDVRIRFSDGYARYWPKISHDGVHWRPLPADRVQTTEEPSTFRLRVPVTAGSVFLSAQPIVASAWYHDWLAELARSGTVDIGLLGQSRAGRPLWVAATPTREQYVLLLGRQHPPEVTGALAMRAFVATVLGDTPLAQRFRAAFQVVVVPLMNPDGVARGFWRHNIDATDLNRDWGPFTQPETQAVRDWLASAEQRDQVIRLMLDFHSTRRNLFYTQTPEDFPAGADFAGRWLTAAEARLPDFAFTREANPPSEQANAKNYFFKRFAIPAITYELGDETEAVAAVQSAVVFAEEMMRELLDDRPTQ